MVYDNIISPLFFYLYNFKKGSVFMINQEKYPILEFDRNTVAKLEPMQKISNINNLDKISLPDCCIITFYKSVIERKKKKESLFKLHI